jgi:uncharacterized alkaline shock family protein YloU
MDDSIKEAKSGFVKINEEVIASVAAVAASEIEGVKYIYGRKPASVSKKAKKQVKLLFNETGVTIDISIVVKYGYIIPEVGSAVQENIIQSVECMTGLKVDAVNVHCTAIAFGRENSSPTGNKNK